MSLKEGPVAKQLDVRGQICPYPIIATRRELGQLQPGQVLEVVTDNPPTANETLPHLCQTRNYPFERTEEQGVWKFLIRKTD